MPNKQLLQDISDKLTLLIQVMERIELAKALGSQPIISPQVPGGAVPPSVNPSWNPGGTDQAIYPQWDQNFPVQQFSTPNYWNQNVQNWQNAFDPALGSGLQPGHTFQVSGIQNAGLTPSAGSSLSAIAEKEAYFRQAMDDFNREQAFKEARAQQIRQDQLNINPSKFNQGQAGF